MLKLIKNEIKTVIESTIYDFTEKDLKELNKLISDALARDKLKIDFCPLTMDIIEKIWTNQDRRDWGKDLPQWNEESEKRFDEYFARLK